MATIKDAFEAARDSGFPAMMEPTAVSQIFVGLQIQELVEKLTKLENTLGDQSNMVADIAKMMQGYLSSQGPNFRG